MCIIKRMQSYSKGMVKQNKMKHILADKGLRMCKNDLPLPRPYYLERNNGNL